MRVRHSLYLLDPALAAEIQSFESSRHQSAHDDSESFESRRRSPNSPALGCTTFGGMKRLGLCQAIKRPFSGGWHGQRWSRTSVTLSGLRHVSRTRQRLAISCSSGGRSIGCDGADSYMRSRHLPRSRDSRFEQCS